MTDLDDIAREQYEEEAAEQTRRSRRATARRPFSVVGLFGELLITLGVLLGLFVVWQLWWTDVVGAHEAEVAVQDFTADLEIPEVTGEARTGRTPPEAAALEGDVFAALYVPDWGDDYVMPIAEGVAERGVLDAGRVGHYPETAMPGQVGNFSVAGHRQTHGRPFYNIQTLQEGDPIVVQTKTAWYVYRVTSHDIVAPSAVEVIAPVPGELGVEASEKMLTLTTCHPLYTTRERYVVHAQLDNWVPLDEGYPTEILEAN